MPVVLVHEGVTQEQYDEAVRRLSGKSRMESPSDWPVDGLLVHAAGQGPQGFRVVDVGNQKRRATDSGKPWVPSCRRSASQIRRRCIRFTPSFRLDGGPASPRLRGGLL